MKTQFLEKKKLLSQKILQLLCISLFIVSQITPNLNAQHFTTAEKQKRTQWFREARFGMFIHFGVYSILGRGEWVRSAEKLSIEDYQPYVDEFNPDEYNPKEWASIAKEAGMKYVVMTAKHHDGFCLFDSKLTDYKSTNSKIKRDLIKEYVEAFRNEGIKVGFYYSLIDWHHPDYPKYADSNHPMRGNEKYKGEKINFDNYLKYMHGQIKELMSNYGKIDILWTDFSYGEMTGAKWKAKELVDMILKLQPSIIMNNRLGGDGTTYNKSEAYGDFESPEQGVPNKKVVDKNGLDIPWETCLTLNNSWGFNKNDHHWKSPELLIHTLINCVSKNGNLLLNVGPDPKGNIPKESIQILKEVGKWVKNNGSSIYNCGEAIGMNREDWGRFTQNGKVIYAHYMYPHIGPIVLEGMQGKIAGIKMLSNGAEASFADEWWGAAKSEGKIFINFNKPIHETFSMPDPISTVFEIHLK